MKVSPKARDLLSDAPFPSEFKDVVRVSLSNMEKGCAPNLNANLGVLGRSMTSIDTPTPEVAGQFVEVSSDPVFQVAEPSCSGAGMSYLTDWKLDLSRAMPTPGLGGLAAFRRMVALSSFSTLFRMRDGTEAGEEVVGERDCRTACQVEIVSSASVRSFSPPFNTTGTETFEARLRGPVPAGAEVRWDIPPPRTPVEAARSGTIDFEDPQSLRTVVHARKPNRGRVRITVFHGARILCQDTKDISVPQFFRLAFDRDEFDSTLEALGLRRSPLATGSLTTDQFVTNVLVARQGVREIFYRLWSVFQGVNVRFVTADPTPVVGADNFSVVVIRGQSPDDDSFGQTIVVDEGNENPSDVALVFAGEFADRKFTVTGDLVYRAISDPVASYDAGTGAPLMGLPVDEGDYADPVTDGTLTLREQQVYIAALTFALLVASGIAHECGHLLGLVSATQRHNAGDTGGIMDEGDRRSFRDRTGIVDYNAATGRTVARAPEAFLPVNLQKLQQTLPILR